MWRGCLARVIVRAGAGAGAGAGARARARARTRVRVIARVRVRVGGAPLGGDCNLGGALLPASLVGSALCKEGLGVGSGAGLGLRSRLGLVSALLAVPCARRRSSG